jgi:hypothetical protein
LNQETIGESRGAIISACDKFRYNLWRITGDVKDGLVGFVMLNPSTADAVMDDATITRCLRRATALGYAGIEIGNLYAYRAKDPKDLKAARFPIGPENDKHLTKMAERCDIIIFGWGNHASPARARTVVNLIKEVNENVYHLGLTKSGQPKHPLYIGYDVKPQKYEE